MPIATASAETLRIAVSSAITTLDPHQASIVQTDLSAISELYTSLVIRGPDLKLLPALAESWRPADELTWEFKLKSGVTFPDGEPLDAAAVKWNIERLLDPATKSWVRTWYAPISQIDATSPTELRIKTTKPYPVLPDQLSMLFLLAPKWTASHNPTIEAMGTGPYDIAEYVAGDRLVLKAKPNYFGAKMTFDEVRIRMIPEAAVRVAALLTGEVDIAFDIPPSDVGRLNASGKAEADWAASNRAMVLKVNALKPPFEGHPELRQALNYAIDKQAIIQSLFEGHGVESNCQMLSPMYFGYNPDLKPYPYDPEKAKQLIKSANTPLPINIDIEVPLGRYLLSQDIGQIIAAQLQDVGFKANVREMEFAAWSNKYSANDLGSTAYLGQAWPTLDADGLLSLYDPSSPVSYWKDKPFGDALASARSTTDAAERLKFYKIATQRMCDQAPVVFLFSQPLVYATSKRIAWRVRGDDWIRAYDIDLK
jgi:peptide/nickel transport system substrate-binding protein